MRELTLNQSNKNVALSSFSQRLEFAKQRVDSLEQYRIQRVLNSTDEGFKQVFSLLATLIHYNSEQLPAYIENAPCGIFNFQQNPLWTEYIPDFSLPSHLASQPAFDGLYVMGSIGSITQTCYSDLDVWLCHSRQFSEAEQTLIEEKLSAVKLWASDLGVEVNFYLMNPAAFQAHQYQDDVTDEHNGSAQHFFLLDEFYRSAIRLAGKPILWLHIDKQGQNYQQLIRQAVENGELNANEWIDFGDFSSLSIGEFFGASLWQLYKGIRSPYKSIIKILLLESYAETYPKTDLISKKFKKLLLSNCGVSYHFDPYLAMLDQVTHYLQQRNETERLDCLRRCFYIKANEGQMSDRCQQILQDLAKQWGWSEKEVALLNDRVNWKVKPVVAHKQMVVEQLLQSYRHLLQFARKFQIDPSIMPQDADFLMRQLYSAFETVPGKVQLINECMQYDLAENDVTFIDVADDGSVKAGWYLTNYAPFSSYDSTRRYVQHNKSLIKSVAWAYFNGLITATTHIHLANSSINLVSLRQFITDLRLSFPLEAPTLCREDLHHPNEIRNLIVAVNLVKDPTKTVSKLSKSEIEQIDLFNLGSSEEGMIGSISIIYRNMWNEVLTKHFEGNDAILKALKFISHKIYLSSAPPQSINVFSYSSQLRGELQAFVLNLVKRCITVKTGSIFQRVQPQVVQMAGKKWHLVFNKNQELKEIVEEVEQRMEPEQAIPQEVYAFASEGFLQFFFDDSCENCFNVYVLDKQNKTESYYNCTGAKEDKIRVISRLYSENSPEQGQDLSESFNFPQFYQLLRLNGVISIVPFQSKQHRDFLEKHHN